MREGAHIRIRPAEKPDLPEINAINNYFLARTTCDWSTYPVTTAKRRKWFKDHSPTLPIFVAECDGRVVGWAALKSFREPYTRAGTADDSVYMHHEFQRRGVGSALIAGARRNGLHSILANITADKEPSIQLHKKFWTNVTTKLMNGTAPVRVPYQTRSPAAPG